MFFNPDWGWEKIQGGFIREGKLVLSFASNKKNDVWWLSVPWEPGPTDPENPVTVPELLYFSAELEQKINLQISLYIFTNVKHIKNHGGVWGVCVSKDLRI